DAMAARIEDMKAAAEREQSEAEAEARRIVADAEERAAVVTRDARTAADRVRAESDREFAAAAQRRGSINAHVANVRQMLATLSRSAHGFAVDPLPEVEDGEAVEAAADVEVDADAVEAPEAAADESVEQAEDAGEAAEAK